MNLKNERKNWILLILLILLVKIYLFGLKTEIQDIN